MPVPVRDSKAQLKARSGLRMSVFEWQMRNQHYLVYLQRLNFGMILLALGLVGIAGWLLNWTSSSSPAAARIFMGGQLLMAQVRCVVGCRPRAAT